MEVDKKVSKYLKEGAFDASADPMAQSADQLSFTSGIRRIGILFAKANTPRKYAIAMEIANDILQKFPMKSKFVWKAVSDAYVTRFGSTSSEV